MWLKFFIIQKTKAIFAVLKLHVLVGPFESFLLNLAYLSKQSRWINQTSKQLAYNDFFSGDRRREKRLDLYTHIQRNYIGEGPIDYLEFGVAQGGSFFWWMEHHTHPEARFFGFDTFTGLPEDYGPFKKGDMGHGLGIPATSDPRASFYQGLFQQTLPGFLSQFPNHRPKVIHLDADLYTATLYTLTTLAPYLRSGDIILFDEFSVPTHEFLAYKNFSESFYVDWEPIAASNNFLFTAFRVK
jgi:hypothetical protein